MILGIGIDIIEIDRIAEKIHKTNGILEKIFSPGEIKYCEKMKNREQHYAGRFAAKEAFLKAAGEGIFSGLSLCEIEITNEASGKPYFTFYGKTLEKVQAMNISKIHLTLTHLKETAAAFVIIE